jgi:hypothetical protein
VEEIKPFDTPKRKKKKSASAILKILERKMTIHENRNKELNA